jgi:hypothetical protein
MVGIHFFANPEAIMADPEQTNRQITLPEGVMAQIQSEHARRQNELEKNRFRLKSQLIWILCGSIVGLLLTWPFQKPAHSLTFLFPAGLLAGITALLYPINIWFERLSLQMEIRIQERSLSDVQKQQLQTTLEKDFFTKLVQINFQYLDEYYDQTGSQADKTFRLTAGVATISICIVISGVVLMFFDKVEAAKVTAGAGILSEFIAAVFFYFYNRTITKMGQYHQKLVITQNIGLAMKIAEGLPEADRVAAQKELIQRLTTDVNRYLTELPEPK